MAYYTNLFSPETYESFASSDRSVSGFRLRQQNAASRVKPGDKLVCYMTKLSRWIGVVQVEAGPFVDETPLFYESDDPFVLRFKVRPLVWLPVERCVPVHDQRLWPNLTFTKGLPTNSTAWTGKVRGSLTSLDDVDGRLLEQVLSSQVGNGTVYPFDQKAYDRLLSRRVRHVDRDVSVTVPEEDDAPATGEVRESIEIQALLADIGHRMGMSIWIPRADQARVLSLWHGDGAKVIRRLPLNYDETTLQTIEQIDVLWLSGRSIRRAFEVEHTTSIYSGLLRMADLLALQPNMDIKLHIVAPSERRDKVKREILRPVFSLLERGPLSETCSYISYEGIRELADIPYLNHLSDSVLDDFEELADDS